MPDAPEDEMREPIRVGPTKGPRCVWGCDGYGWHARNCPDSPDYDPNWIDELAAQIKRDIEQNVRTPATDTPAETRERRNGYWLDRAMATMRRGMKRPGGPMPEEAEMIAMYDVLAAIGRATVTHDPEPFRNHVISILAALSLPVEGET